MCSGLLRNGRRVPLVLAGIFDLEELNMVNSGGWSGLPCCGLGCHLA